MAWHYLPKNHSIAIPRRIVFLDTETIKEPIDGHPRQFNNYLRCGYATSVRIEKGEPTRRHHCHFDDAAIFWQWFATIIGRNHTTWLVAHRASYDCGVIGLWNKIDTGQFKLDSPRGKRTANRSDDTANGVSTGLCVLDDPPFILGLSNSAGERFAIVDTLNWFRCPLAEMGTACGLPKLPMPDESGTANDWRIYNERDVEILEKSFLGLINFVKTNDLGMFRYTAPGQAMAAYRHKYMATPIVLHDEADVKRLERKAYFGGETRCFWSGKIERKLFQVDVNSLYPFVMYNGVFPCCLRSWNKSGQQSITQPWPELERCIATVELDTEREYPIRDNVNQISYCKGRFVTSLAGPELRFAAAHNDIVRYIDWSYYSLAPIFRQYVSELFALRQAYQEQRNPLYATLCKLLLNSLYGKFGQKTPKWEQCPGKIPLERWAKWLEIDATTGQRTTYRSMGDYVFRECEPTEHPQSFPAIAAYVTSYGRQYMRFLRKMIGDAHVYYQATDSLIVDQEGLLTLACEGYINDTEMGKLKIEAEGNQAEFRGINNYTIGSKVIRSGVRRNASPIDKGRWYQELFEKAEQQIGRKPIEAVRSWQTIFTERNGVYRGYVTSSQRIESLKLS